MILQAVEDPRVNGYLWLEWESDLNPYVPSYVNRPHDNITKDPNSCLTSPNTSQSWKARWPVAYCQHSVKWCRQSNSLWAKPVTPTLKCFSFNLHSCAIRTQQLEPLHLVFCLCDRTEAWPGYVYAFAWEIIVFSINKWWRGRFEGRAGLVLVRSSDHSEIELDRSHPVMLSEGFCINPMSCLISYVTLVGCHQNAHVQTCWCLSQLGISDVLVDIARKGWQQQTKEYG